jgi:hypothetical protein
LDISRSEENKICDYRPEYLIEGLSRRHGNHLMIFFAAVDHGHESDAAGVNNGL